MANPDTENGYTRIANELFEAILRHPFSKRELNVVLAIIRKTYGFNKKSDDMTGQQIASLTNIKRQHIHVCLNDLLNKNIVLKQDGSYGQVIGLNKNYNEWMLEPKQDALKQDVPKQFIGTSQNSSSGSPKTVRQVVPKQDIQKTTPKDNSKRQLQKTVAKGETAPPIGRIIWEAYSISYFNRYGIDPVRNAKINGQLSQFAKRVPQDEAPHIAAFYVRHNGSFYASKLHPVGLLLADAEKLRTEWATNRQMTATRARQIDEKQSNHDLVAECVRLDKLEGKS